MVTAIDTSILGDLLIEGSDFLTSSRKALGHAAANGALVVNEVVIAETTPMIQPGSMSKMMRDWNLVFAPSSAESASLAGEMYREFLKRGGKRDRVVPDFLIGAHALIHADRLLARDRGYFRNYFKDLKVWIPGE